MQNVGLVKVKVADKSKMRNVVKVKLKGELKSKP